MSTYCRRGDHIEAEFSAPPLVDSAESALDVIFCAAHRPERAEVIALVLDADFRGHSVVIVDGTHSPDAVIEILELLGESTAESGRISSIVLASVRPDLGPLPGDVDRWIELSEIADTFGCELLEWFVINDDVAWCPRDLLAEPPRWPEAW